MTTLRAPETRAEESCLGQDLLSKPVLPFGTKRGHVRSGTWFSRPCSTSSAAFSLSTSSGESTLGSLGKVPGGAVGEFIAHVMESQPRRTILRCKATPETAAAHTTAAMASPPAILRMRLPDPPCVTRGVGAASSEAGTVPYEPMMLSHLAQPHPSARRTVGRRGSLGVAFLEGAFLRQSSSGLSRGEPVFTGFQFNFREMLRRAWVRAAAAAGRAPRRGFAPRSLEQAAHPARNWEHAPGMPAGGAKISGISASKGSVYDKQAIQGRQRTLSRRHGGIGASHGQRVMCSSYVQERHGDASPAEGEGGLQSRPGGGAMDMKEVLDLAKEGGIQGGVREAYERGSDAIMLAFAQVGLCSHLPLFLSFSLSLLFSPALKRGKREREDDAPPQTSSFFERSTSAYLHLPSRLFFTPPPIPFSLPISFLSPSSPYLPAALTPTLALVHPQHPHSAKFHIQTT